jgi:two-component system, chemotaxis family, protein-glutamate methylesterase/glutaminase
MFEGYELTRPYTLTCPECGGALFPPTQEPVLHYSCHIGHVLNWESLMEAQLDRIEAALGTALVVMKERAELCRHLGAKHGAPAVEAHMLQRMLADAEERASRIKALLEEAWMPVP